MAHSFSFFDFDQSIEFMNQLPELNPCALDYNSTISVQNFISSSISKDNFITQQAADLQGNFPGILALDEKNVIMDSQPNLQDGYELHESKKRKLLDEAENSSENTFPMLSECGIPRKNSSRGKKVRNNENEEDKAGEVVHVRARRGQATDSHSLAERVRRGKINEKLRFLQDIVPGCYKTMGMALMLDEIIHYVQSLQNQVEFLSMKLTAASSFYDFNTERHVMESIQPRETGDKLHRGYKGVDTTEVGPLDSSFGTYPSFPYNT